LAEEKAAMTASPPATLTGGRARVLRTSARVLRITARTLSALVLAFAVVMFIGYTRAGEGPFNQRADKPGANQAKQDTCGDAVGLTLTLVALTGSVIGWRWERLGGGLAAGSMALFLLIALGAASDRTEASAGLLAATVFGLPGVCFLHAGLLTRYEERSRGPSPPATAGTLSPP
jgi:hypothetical protein